MELKRWVMDARVLLGMLLVQAIATGLQILSRVILSEGTFVFALMTYRHVVAALSIAPFALYFERGALRKISFEAFIYLFAVAMTGILMAMGLFYYGLKETTATYATNFLNLVPVVTFLFSTILRIEKLRLHTKGGKIKSVGVMLCLAGALTMALYKGKTFNFSDHHNNHEIIIIKSNQNKTTGTLFLIGSCISYGIWFMLQVKLFKIFPHKLSATLVVCIIASIQATLVGLCMDRKPKSWRLGWNLQLITIFYSGVLATAATFALISMAIKEKGPTYPSMFNPLALILILIIEVIFFAEDLSIGSLIGMVLIMAGLYSFLWARNMDMKASAPPPSPTLLKEINGGGGEGRAVVEESTLESGGLRSSAVVIPANGLSF